ncbi:MAG: tetratricopeptide repeat protein [Pirellulaceae bacterium]
MPNIQYGSTPYQPNKEVRRSSKWGVSETIQLDPETPSDKLAIDAIRIAAKHRERAKYHEALVYYNRAIELSPKNEAAYIDRGLTYSRLGRHREALADLDKAIELNPMNAKAYNNRGFIRMMSESFQQAIVDFNRAIALRPDYGVAYYNRGVAHRKLGDRAKADRDFAKAKSVGYQVPAAKE